jgi:hypothetical protein
MTNLPCIDNIPCADPTAGVIQVILDLAQTSGSTSQQIFDRLPLVCPSIVLSLSQIETVLKNGTSRGVFFKQVPTIISDPTYLIIANMVKFNVANRVYYRPPCQTDSFYM